MLKKYHTSLYTIFVKLEDGSEDYLLVHGYRGAIDHVTANVAHFLRSGAPVSREEVEGLGILSETFDVLKERGYVTDKSPMEEKQIVRKMAEALHKKGGSNRKNFLFLVAYDCNFRCPYCFENAISNNGKGWSKKVFSKEAVEKAFQAMAEVEPERQKHNDEITLYGGEPLLKQNKEIVQHIVEEGTKKGYYFKAITNGYDLDHYLDLLVPDKIRSLQITIDGVPEKHDARRTHYRDGESFYRIMENMSKVLAQNVSISVRINTDLTNFDDIQILHSIFRDWGFFEYKHFGVYSALVHGADQLSCNVVMTNKPSEETQPKESFDEEFKVEGANQYDPDSQYIDFELEENRFSEEGTDTIQFHDELTREHAETDKIYLMNRGKYINKHYKAIEANPSLHQISCQDFGIAKTIRNVLEGQGLMPFRSVFCSAQTSMMLFDPYGDIYTCWETVGMDEHKVGNYRNGVEIYEEELDKWYGRNISKTPACSKCKYAFFCGGGCQAHALAEGRGYDSSYCDGFPKTFQVVVPREYDKFVEKRTESSQA